ncbi:NAD(P)H-hydrate dehydratase [bacterium (Candidatus Gribaldobacteria) CG_4_10_14_0_2_um_filter_33_15]|nr:MAG: NAD(P)H-hydrate dehydratase [bacterium (Candidatus Gribaldobacteria) CG_4_10_14_0_2_um_filter_33_15]
MIKVGKNILKEVYKQRSPDVHKYDFGLLLVIGGGEFYTGSPTLAALAAFKTGVDMVRILAPKRAADIIATFSPNLAAYPLKGKWLEGEDLPALISMAESAERVAHGKTAIVIGGGLGRTEETKETIIKFLSQVSTKAVIDADAIHAIALRKELIKEKNFLITPHCFEFFILTGRQIQGLPLGEKVKIVQEEAGNFGVTILLKERIDIISNGKEVAINETGSPFMTKGGTGDTLAGICGSLLAQGIEPFTAAQAAAFINGKAGEIAANKLKESLTATDLIEAIPEVLR